MEMVHKSGRIGCLFTRDLLYSTTYTRLLLGRILWPVYWQVQVWLETWRRDID